jgi:hypothetical protein
MTQQHPITLPPKVLQQLRSKAPAEGWFRDAWIAEQAAKWGADQELEACCEWLENQPQWMEDLRAARRSKPPSLKKQALMALEDGDTGPGASLTSNEVEIIRRALESIND